MQVDKELPIREQVAAFVRAVHGECRLADPGRPRNQRDQSPRPGKLGMPSLDDGIKLGPPATPHAWRAVFERREDRRVVPLQFAVAGMNAHINFDLPRALVETCRALGTTPDAGSHRRDFDRVNEILAEVEPAIRERLEKECPLDDRQLEHLENVLANWSTTRAREAAWDHSEVLWWLQGNAAMTSTYTGALDRTVGLAGRGLLVPLVP